jgi:hypothetical protein
MPGKAQAGPREGAHRLWLLRQLLLAALLAALTALVAAGPAQADGWPSEPPESSQR